MADAWLQKETIIILRNAAPSESEAVTDDQIQDCQTLLDRLTLNDRYSCLTQKSFDDFASLGKFLHGMSGGAISASVDVSAASTSPFLQSCFDAVGDWFKYRAPSVVKKGVLSFKDRMLRGKPAASAAIADLTSAVVNGVPKGDLRKVRQFSWLLDGPERTLLECWVEATVKATKVSLVSNMMLKDSRAANGIASSSSSEAPPPGGVMKTAIVAAPVAMELSTGPKAKKLKIDDKKAAMKAMMMAICAGNKK